MVEGTGLENRQAGNRLVGSNPTLSAIRRRLCEVLLHRLDDRFADEALFRCGCANGRCLVRTLGNLACATI